METKKEKEAFSLVRRVSSTNHAMRGFIILLKTGHNFWMQIFFTLLAVYMGVILNISSTEWAMVVIVAGLVFLAEAFNTAIEIDIDLTSPNYHPYAKDTKDVAAAGVIIASLIATIIGLIIFLPKILAFYF